MKPGVRQSAAWLHAVAGIGVGWIVYFIFLTGTLGYFDTEIDRWMRPELPLSADELSQEDALALAVRYLQGAAGGAARWSVYPPNGHETRQLTVTWPMPPDSAGRILEREALLDHRTGLPIDARATGGGQALYRLHHSLHYLPPSLTIWIVGVAAMAMLAATVTGTIARRGLFREFFRLRAFRPRRSWLDIHNFLGVTVLPFHLLIAYSGLVFFMFTYMAFVVSATYGPGGQQDFFDEVFDNPDLPEAADVAAPLPPIAAMSREAETVWGESPLRLVTFYNPGDANARVVFTRSHVDLTSAGGRMILDGTSGRLISRTDARTGTAAVNDAVLALHEGLFAGTGLRILYFFAGICGTATIGAGLVAWVSRRKARLARGARNAVSSLRAVERLNIGTIVGLPTAIGVYLGANRLLPLSLVDRAAWEMHALFIAWALLLLLPWLMPVARAWQLQFWLAASVFFLVPAINAVTTDYGLAASIGSGNLDIAAIDLTMLGIASVLVWAALRQRSSDLR